MNKDKSPRGPTPSTWLDIAEGAMFSIEDLARDHVYEPPYVMKPIAEGSVVAGVFIVRAGAPSARATVRPRN